MRIMDTEPDKRQIHNLPEDARVVRRSVGLRPLVTAGIGLVIIVASVGTYLRWWNLSAAAGGYTIDNWLGWGGSGLLAILVPSYSLLKRHSKLSFHTLVQWHVWGNLVAFGLISMHFAQHLDRAVHFGFPLDTGFSIYLLLSGIVITGVIKRFTLMHKAQEQIRLIHLGLGLSLIVVVPVHILSTLRVI